MSADALKGRPVDKRVEQPIYFTKSPQTPLESDATVALWPETESDHHEMERVDIIGQPRFRVPEDRAHERVCGYACGRDMTRRDFENVGWILAETERQAAAKSAIHAAVPKRKRISLERGAAMPPRAAPSLTLPPNGRTPLFARLFRRARCIHWADNGIEGSFRPRPAIRRRRGTM
jgi:2-keto-4-pentenoate hydratase/2-oxohepta-3-ene-1,7-dioic acid hydratase in catechol pathway